MGTTWMQKSLALALCAGSVMAGGWQRNTFPGQGHVDNGFAAGAGWSHMESTMDISVSPLDPDFRAVLENEWGAVYTEDGLNYAPLCMPHIGTPGCSAQSIEFSRYDADTMYLRVAHDYWENMDPTNSPAGLWRSSDRGATWSQLYQPPSGGYEFNSANNAGRAHILEDPCPLRANHLYFGTTSDGLVRSTNNGVTWSPVVPGLSGRRIKTIAAATNGLNETILYVIAEKAMPRHTAGQSVPLDNWAPGDYSARWKFNENLDDSSSNSYDLSGSVAGWTDSTIEGRYAVVFDGSSALTSTNLIYSGTQSKLSASVWVQTTNVADQIIASFDPNEYWELGTCTGRVVWTVRDSGGAVNEVVGSRIDDGDWHHVAGVFENGNLRLYVDGEEVAATPAGTSLLGSGNSVSGVVGTSFTGALDDMRIYNARALTLSTSRGIYLEEDKKNPMPQGQLWRIRVDAAGNVAEAVRLHAPLADFHDVEVNPLDPSRGWVIRKSMPFAWPYGGRGLYRFSDYGETLTPSTAVLTQKYQTFDVVKVNPGNTNHVFLACGGALRYGLRWSMDGGTTWQGTDRNVGGSIPSVESWNPMDYKTYGMGLDSGVNDVYAGAPFSFVPGEPGKLLWISALNGGLLQSADYGATWATGAAGGPNKDLGQIAVAHGDPDHWAVGLYEHGFSVTTNNGLSWVAETHHNNALLESLAEQAEAAGSWWTAARVGAGVAFHPTNSDIMVATWSRRGYILRSTDAGRSWIDTGYRNPMDLLVDVFWSRTDPNRVYAGRMKSDDAGLSWTDIGKVVISVCDSDSERIVGVDDWQTDVLAASLNMYVSTNGGASWTSLPDPPRETAPGTIYQPLVTATGRKWNCTADALVAIDPRPGSRRILLAGRSGIYEYSEVSNDWILRNNGLENSPHYNRIEPVPWMGFVVFDPRPGFGHIVYAAKQNDDRTLGGWSDEANPNHAYPGGENSEPFYRSIDGGITWEKLHGANHPGAPKAAMIESMVVDMRGRMFAATTEGIYIFSDPDAGHGEETIEFISDEGYLNGDLVGQLGWTGNAGIFTVNTNHPGSVAVGSGGWKRAYHAPSLGGGSGSTFTLGASFGFTETAPSSGIKNAFRIEFGGDGNEAVSLSFKRLTNGKYELGLYENSGDNSYVNGADLLPEDVGTTNGAGAASDPLYMELSLVKGATESNWTAQAKLYNLTDDPLRACAPLDSITFGFVSSIEFYGNLLRPALNSADQASANISDVVVDSVTIESDASPFVNWIAGYGLSGSDADMTADPDSDQLNNLTEYALGGDPTHAADVGILPTLGNSQGLEYIYRRRLDPAASGLAYWVETCTNLVSNVWTNSGTIEIGTAPIDDEFESVTNSVGIDGETQEFIRLKILGE